MSRCDQFLTFGEAAMRAALVMTEDEFAMARCCGQISPAFENGTDGPRWSYTALMLAIGRRTPSTLGGMERAAFRVHAVDRAKAVEVPHG